MDIKSIPHVYREREGWTRPYGGDSHLLLHYYLLSYELITLNTPHNLHINMKYIADIRKIRAALKINRWPLIDYVKQAEEEQQNRINKLYPKK